MLHLYCILLLFLVAAAAMPLHWIYSQSEIKGLVGSGNPEVRLVMWGSVAHEIPTHVLRAPTASALQFFNPPSCPFYKYKSGMGTPYGQQTIIVLQAMAASGTVSPTALEAAYYDVYKAGGPAAAGSWYFDASTKGFVSNVAAGRHWPRCGASDTQAGVLRGQRSLFTLAQCQHVAMGFNSAS